MLTLNEVHKVLADVKLDSVSGETGFTNGMSETLRAFRDRIATRGLYSPEEIERMHAEGKANARFIAENRSKG